MLAGDSLHALAFQLLADPETHEDPFVRAELVQELARAAGPSGMAGGQMMDLMAEGEPLDQSIELYQEGDRLRRHCEARLKAAQARIEQIAFGSDGSPRGTAPFDAG